jgi:hypothetical protein
MADAFLRLSAKDRRDALGVAADQSGRSAHLLEKDVWVVWALAALYGSPLGEHLVFKGGTSLSKAYRVIRRFSEDVDPTYDIRQIAPELMGADGEALPKARSEEKRWSNEVRRRLPEWIAPDVDIYVVDGSYNKLLCGLIAKTIDVAVMPVHRANLGDKVTSLWSERIVVALPSGHTASPLPERQRAGEGNRVQIRNPARWAGTGFH